MPLDRAHVTVASRVMLPAYTGLNAVFAVVFLTDPQQRLQKAPSLDYARGWLPISAWGLLWFTLAVLMIVALLVRHRETFVGALAVNAAAWFLWGLLTAAAVATQPNVTPLAGALPWFVAAASFASMLSLLHREL